MHVCSLNQPSWVARTCLRGLFVHTLLPIPFGTIPEGNNDYHGQMWICGLVCHWNWTILFLCDNRLIVSQYIVQNIKQWNAVCDKYCCDIVMLGMFIPRIGKHTAFGSITFLSKVQCLYITQWLIFGYLWKYDISFFICE